MDYDILEFGVRSSRIIGELVLTEQSGAIFVTIGGRLSDLFGRRYFFIAGAIILIIGSIVSATGQSINQMIAGGAIFGAGSGFLEMAFGAVQVGGIQSEAFRYLTSRRRWCPLSTGILQLQVVCPRPSASNILTTVGAVRRF